MEVIPLMAVRCKGIIYFCLEARFLSFLLPANAYLLFALSEGLPWRYKKNQKNQSETDCSAGRAGHRT
jgi:hypothetical protein